MYSIFKPLHIAIAMRKFLPVIALLLATCLADSQTLSFMPGTDVYATLEMEMYTEHYLYVNHDGTADSTYLTWRLVGNTCPETWDFQMCDFQHCYSGMPTSGDMSGLAPGQTGNLRLIVNPSNIPGSGDVQFWVYPTGHSDEHIDVFFHFTTTVTNISTEENVTSCFFDGNHLNITSQGNHDLTIFSQNGTLVYTTLILPGNTLIPLLQWPSGIYFCQLDQTAYSFFKP